MADRPGILIMAKAPVPGTVKTRLAAEIGDAAALRVYRALLERTRTVAHAAAAELDAAVGWWVAGDDGVAWARTFDPAAEVVAAQTGPDLGARMRAAMAAADARGWRPMVVLGTDAPALNVATIRQALGTLLSDDADVVVAPAQDGGYVMIALKRLAPYLFSGPAWGTATVLSTTRDLARRHGLRMVALEPQTDLDTMADLRRFDALFRLVDAD